MTPTVIKYAACALCHHYGYVDVGTLVCVDDTACVARLRERLDPGRAPTVRPPPPAAPTCDCGAATADPVSTRRSGGPGHAGWCSVGGRP